MYWASCTLVPTISASPVFLVFCFIDTLIISQLLSPLTHPRSYPAQRSTLSFGISRRKLQRGTHVSTPTVSISRLLGTQLGNRCIFSGWTKSWSWSGGEHDRVVWSSEEPSIVSNETNRQIRTDTLTSGTPMRKNKRKRNNERKLICQCEH